MKTEFTAMYVLLTAVIVTTLILGSNADEFQVRGSAGVAVGSAVTQDEELASELDSLGSKATAALQEDFHQIERDTGASLSVEHKPYGTYSSINYAATGSGGIHALVQQLLDGIEASTSYLAAVIGNTNREVLRVLHDEDLMP